ncbi:hypothetical protein LPJ55_005043 [Coemansia sp. RSA 990]|nr:hypothetical protein BX667DRAFT_513493 [Coemansia mojavensis]KAJ1740351.1 hypothetical protein LPJ68_003834 [Coemansia sp. RSA 1086]KAJ1747713.1 hypothetical protein LPJ79_005054 [Coemansia sp. RSA 1821]KAJ1869914.1 hypothetical protein LPJ55_005043 [Coemansia sp. RSA 990]KAJ2669205.1 hypothetical protein IWW42_004747 [Coemansia sp. RSA 1085]
MVATRSISRRQQQPQQTSDIPDYVLVSPENVALAPSSPDGLDSNAINDIMCLVNRFRYDNNLTTLALDASLVRFAQARAELLSKDKIEVENNSIVGTIDPLVFNSSVWRDVKENILVSEQNPTFAYWEMLKSDAAKANLAQQSAVYFGVGYYNGYYVQALGEPLEVPADIELFPWCPSNETFWNWVFPNDAPEERVDDGSNLVDQAFPYEQYADALRYYDPNYPAKENGLVSEPKYYFTPPEGSVPYLKNLAIENNVAAANSSTPFAAIAPSGEKGMTAEELNLMACLINARRYDSCLPPLALHPQLIAAAQAHSYEMNRAQNMSHHGSAGSLGNRVRRRGFSFGAVGENVGYNMHTAYQAHVGFSESIMHLRNMLNPAYTFVGAGRSGQYWTVTFGSYLDQSITPPLDSLPLCPGSSLDISIAFPSGLPDAPKLETSACGGTEATSISTPPEIETLLEEFDKQNGNEEEPTPTPSEPEENGGGTDQEETDQEETDQEETDQEEADQEETDQGETDQNDEDSDDDDQSPDDDKPSEPNHGNGSKSTTISNGENTPSPTDSVPPVFVNIAVVTEVIMITVFVDGDALEANNDESSSEPEYSASSLDGSGLDIIVGPEFERSFQAF